AGRGGLDGADADVVSLRRHPVAFPVLRGAAHGSGSGVRVLRAEWRTSGHRWCVRARCRPGARGGGALAAVRADGVSDRRVRVRGRRPGSGAGIVSRIEVPRTAPVPLSDLVAMNTEVEQDVRAAWDRIIATS